MHTQNKEYGGSILMTKVPRCGPDPISPLLPLQTNCPNPLQCFALPRPSGWRRHRRLASSSSFSSSLHRAHAIKKEASKRPIFRKFFKCSLLICQSNERGFHPEPATRTDQQIRCLRILQHPFVQKSERAPCPMPCRWELGQRFGDCGRVLGLRRRIIRWRRK